MRHFSGSIALFAIFCLGSSLLADEPRDVIDRGIKARAAKPELLDKQKICVMTMLGKMLNTEKGEVAATFEIVAEWPSHCRYSVEMMAPDGTRRAQLGLQIDKGWVRAPGQPTMDMNSDQVDEFKMEVYGRWLTTLYPLKDRGFTLTLMKDSRVDGDEVSVVKATLRFRPDVLLSFSKKSGHLLKASYKARESGVEMRKEHLFSDFKEFDGLTLPSKLIDMKQVGNLPATKDAEWTISSYKFPDKLGAESFSKPEKK